MTQDDSTDVTVLGLGAMGAALAAATVAAGNRTTVWNRSPGRAEPLAERGAVVAATPAEAVAASPLIVACLLGADSVREVLDPLAAEMAGRTLVNVTTTTPNEAREIAAWAADHGIEHLDGGIMAVPEMIGQEGSSILYSGPAAAFERHREVLDLWGESVLLGDDGGLASLYDLALLTGMYTMFAGFMHGAAMVASAGIPATAFVKRAAPFLAAMAGGLDEYATVIDSGDYLAPGQQSLEFSDLGDLVQASVDEGVNPEVIAPVQALIARQIAAGHGKAGFARIYEEIRSTTP